VDLVVERDKKEQKFEKVKLSSAEQSFPQAFLGVLPIRDDPDKGVEVRHVQPKSPADKAGIKDGDRITKVSSPVSPNAPLQEITRGRNQLMDTLTLCRPNQQLKLEVKAKATGKTSTLTVTLGELPNSVPDKLPERSTAKKALTPFGGKPPAAKPKPETGFQKKQTPAQDHTYWIYVPDDYDPDISYSILVWFHPLGKNKEKDFEDFSGAWETFCSERNIILVMPQSDSPRGWTPNEADFVNQAIRIVQSEYTVDSRRTVAHGLGVGGEMAMHMGFQSRALIRGVATVGAHLGGNPREKVLNQPLSFYLVVGGKDPVQKAVGETKDKLAKFKYPVVLKEIPNLGHEYIDGKLGVPALEEMVRWIDSLDWI
jgi:serine protease Do